MDKKNYFKRILTILIIIIGRGIIILGIIIYIYVRMNINRETDMPKSIEDYNNFELMADVMSGNHMSAIYEEKKFIVYRDNNNMLIYKHRELPKDDKYYKYNKIFSELREEYGINLITFDEKRRVLYSLIGSTRYNYIKMLDGKEYNKGDHIPWLGVIKKRLDDNYYIIQECSRSTCPEIGH